MTEETKAPKPGNDGIDPDKLKGVISEIEEFKGRSSEANGQIGAIIKRAEDKFGINRIGLQIGLRLKNFDATKRADVLRTLDKIIQVYGLDAQPDMFEDDDTQEAA